MFEIFSRTRNFALRERGLFVVSSAEGIIGFLVRIFISGTKPQIQGISEGHWQGCARKLNVFLTMRSSSE